MRSVVIAYEDAYHESFHGLIKALRRDHGLPGIILEPRTVRGTGGFANEAPKLLRTPLKQTRLPPDRLICVADADRPQNLVPGSAPAAPASDLESSNRWVRDFEQSWRAFLVREGKLTDDVAARLGVLCLRWNKETLLAASPDALLDHAARRGRRDQLDSVLRGCDPCPTTLADDAFVLRYLSPQRCMAAVMHAIEDRGYKKGRDDEDILRDWVCPDPERRARVSRRCPDLLRLLGEIGGGETGLGETVSQGDTAAE